jgi:hypothetical protein
VANALLMQAQTRECTTHDVSAETRSSFDDWSRPKSRVVQLLERTFRAESRLEAVAQLLQCASQQSKGNQNFRATVSECFGKTFAGTVRATRHDEATMAEVQTATQNGHLRSMMRSQRKLPFVFKPPATDGHVPQRGPWDGFRLPLRVGEFATGSGCFMAAAVAAGMEGAWMAEPDKQARQLAAVNCPSVPVFYESMLDVDPAALPWTHVLLGGSCCQPFSAAGRQRGWADDRAYSTLRFLHNVAAQLPWVAILENVAAITQIHDGAVWRLIKGVLSRLGYHVQPLKVCPSR